MADHPEIILLLVTAGFTVCEKLDRTYLPPPGSKFSGGSPGDIQTPLEFPKEYPSRLTQTANNGLPTLDDPRIELGINRGLEIATVSTTPFPVTHFQTSSRVPSTTTSYAFSQTSIFPVDSYETTTAAVISNFPTTRPVNDFREHLVSKHPQSSNNPQYQQGFGQSLIKSQIAQPRFRTTDSPIYSAQLATKNNSFYSGLNDQKYNQQQTMPSGHETNPSSPNTFELFKNRYNSENVHDPSRIHYPSNSYLPVKQNKQVYNVEKQYQQYYRRPISRYPAAQIASDKQKEGAAHLFEETNTPILAPEFSEQSTIPTSNYVTNLSSTPSKDYPTSVYQELPHQTSLSGIRKIVSSSLPDIYSDSSSRTGFPKTQAKENLNQLNTNENNFLTTEISQKPLSYNYTQKTSNRFSHPGYYSTTAAPVSPVQFTGDYPSAILNNQIPSIYSSEVVPGSVNKPLIYKTKSTPSPFQPLITSTYSGNKGILTPAPVLESTNIAFENTPTDVSIGTQSPSKLLHTTNQAYSTTSASGVTNIPSNIGDSAKESQSVFVPKADNTQYAIKSLAQPSYSTAHKKDHPDSPQMESDRNAVILNYENVINPDGFKYSYDTSNGIHAEETGTANDGVKATGGFSYTGDDGKVYTITYSADENGFRPSGDHLPTPPPIPEAILRMLEQNTKDEEAGIFDDGSYNEDKYGHKKYQGTNDYDIWQPVYSRPSINIPQPTKQELDRINKENSNTVNLTKLHEHNIEDYVDEEDQTEHGIPINFVPSKHVHSNNESIKNGTFIRKIGKPITAEINYSDIIGHSEILLDSKDSTSSDLHKYLPTPSDILKDDSKSSVTSQRLDQRKPIDKTLENIKNIPEPIMELDLTNGNQYIGTHKNNGFKPTKGESKNNYETNYVQRNRGPMVNSNKGIPKFTTDQTYQEITNKPLGRGYVYNPPQNKNFPAPNEFQMQSSAGEVISTIRPFSSRQETAINESNRKPFMTPNVSREDVYDKYYNNSSPYENKSESVHPESQFLENVDHDSGSEVTDSETLTSTSRHPEYDTTPNFKTFTPYQKEGNRYAENKFTHSTTQEPGENSSLKTSTPLRDSVKFESTSSPEDTDVSQISQYPATFRPIKGSRITGYPSSTDSTIIANTFNSAPQKLTHDNVPSTTFRPNYTIFQENRPEGLNVDIYGRPIDTESYDEGPIETRPKHGKNFQTGSLPGKGLVADSDFYPSDKAEYNEQIRQEGLNVGKDVQAPSYPSSFDKVKGENFSGTTRNQKFDPQIGYYYK